ncbi:MAG: hypothetical protein N2Z62_04990 [Rhodobacteraceae bacterium]|nr:hypothetical protein [Paracoccaceae bacterium]
MTDLREAGGARARLYRSAPALDGLRTAAVGDFRCESTEAGAALLRSIAAELAAEGFRAVIGPMNGDTWHSYRLVTESDGSPPFLLEPVSKPQDLAAFAAAGFAPVGRYVSARVAAAAAVGAPPAPIPGLRVEPWDGADPEARFAAVHALSLEAFAGNAFYTPISREAFLAMYMPLVPMLRPELVFLARHEGRLVGFLFGIPDYQQGPKPRSAILKTYASRLPGVGHALAHAFHEAAVSAGFETVIHALIHEANASADRSRRHGGQVFRRYALMGRRL